MQLQEQVISLEQAKKLKELGFIGESALLWNTERWGFGGVTYPVKEYLALRHRESTHDTSLNAYTASELMDILPAEIYDAELSIRVGRPKSYKVSYSDILRGHEEIRYIHRSNKHSLAQALGDMLIYLIENNLFPTTTNEA